ncbi:hypothetical protein LG322_03115 [Microbacterium aerolatum]|uniref:hypothetical protein n=1 Tax=Microbacterium aerolatum TaxID=153731 RepID=UPI00384D292D
MPLLLSDRASLSSPLALHRYDELRMLGVDPRAPDWKRLRKGIYVDRAAFDRLPAWKRYEVRVHAFLLTNPGSILCLESAAVLHGIPLFGEAKDIHVLHPGGATTTRNGDVCFHTSADAREIVRVGSALATSVPDTVSDLARVLSPAKALAAADAVISPVQGGAFSIDDLRARGSFQQNRRGVRLREWVWEHADLRSESPGESVSRAVILWSGFEAPVLQRDFRYEGAVDRTDFFFESCEAVGESDGWGKYDLSDPDAAEEHLRREKVREDRLRRHGHPMARWTATDTWKVDPLCRALVQAGVRRVEHPHSAFLATLRRNPRELRRPQGSRIALRAETDAGSSSLDGQGNSRGG